MRFTTPPSLLPITLVLLALLCSDNCATAQPDAFRRLEADFRNLNFENSGVRSSRGNDGNVSKSRAYANGRFEANSQLLQEIRSLQQSVLKQRIAQTVLAKQIERQALIQDDAAENAQAINDLENEIEAFRGLRDDDVALEAEISSIRNKVQEQSRDVIEQSAQAYLQSESVDSADLQSLALDENVSLTEEELVDLDDDDLDRYLELTFELRQLQDKQTRLGKRLQQSVQQSENRELSLQQRRQAEQRQNQLRDAYLQNAREMTRTRIALRRMKSRFGDGE